MSRRDQLLHVVGDVIVPVCFIVLVPMLGMFWVIDRNAKERIHAAQLASCERGNVVRQRINDEAAEERAIYTQAAVVLREMGETDAAAALAAVLAAGASRIKTIDLVNCEDAVHNPDTGGTS